MIALTSAEVTAITQGYAAADAVPGVVVDGPVVVDSRAAAPGSLFVAVRGERVDGHDFGAEAAARGAVLALGTRPVDRLPTVVVADPVVALGRLAHDLLGRLDDVGVVGVTGSVGKTTTKDLLAAVLSADGPTVAPPGSYNTEVGLPLTVLAADRATRHLVLEMGARGVGHIRTLTAIAPPDVGVVLTVGSAHVGAFGSRESVAAAKGELVESLTTEGLAVLNADDALVAAMAGRTKARVVTFGRRDTADVRAEDVVLEDGRASFRLRTAQGSAAVRLRLVGTHQVTNALAAAAVGLAYDLAPAAVGELLSAAEPASRWRMEVVERADGVTVINDAYNANPESVAAALETLAGLAAGRRTWAVLGEMLELGPESVGYHEAVGRQAAALHVSRLVVVGEGARGVLSGAQQAGPWAEPPLLVDDAEAASQVLRSSVRPGDVVLVKASRGIGLDRVAAALLEEAAG